MLPFKTIFESPYDDHTGLATSPLHYKKSKGLTKSEEEPEISFFELLLAAFILWQARLSFLAMFAYMTCKYFCIMVEEYNKGTIKRKDTKYHQFSSAKDFNNSNGLMPMPNCKLLTSISPSCVSRTQEEERSVADPSDQEDESDSNCNEESSENDPCDDSCDEDPGSTQDGSDENNDDDKDKDDEEDDEEEEEEDKEDEEDDEEEDDKDDDDDDDDDEDDEVEEVGASCNPLCPMSLDSDIHSPMTIDNSYFGTCELENSLNHMSIENEAQNIPENEQHEELECETLATLDEEASELESLMDHMSIDNEAPNIHENGQHEVEYKILVSLDQQHLGVDFQNDNPRYLPHVQYDRQKLAGQGTFGKCNQIKDRAKKTILAEKVIPADRHEPRELDIWKAIMEHPNILKIYGAILFENEVLVYSPLAQGGTLKSFLTGYRDRTGRKIPERLLFVYFNGIMSGVKHIHSKNYLHRDIKSENILMMSVGGGSYRAVICDFGLASSVTDHTSRHAVYGTAQYASPEAVRSEPLSFPTDIWSAGCVLAEMHTGDPPWKFQASMGVGTIIYAIGNAKRPPIPEDCTGLLLELFNGMLQLDPKDRKTAKQIVDLLSE